MKFKKLVTYGLPVLATVGLTTSLAISLTACSKEQIQSIFEKIKNAIHAIGTLAGSSVGKGDHVVENTADINKIRKVLANSFGVDIDEFNSSIQTLNLVPIKNEDKQINSWIITILLKEDSNDVWPQELIDSPQNSANENKEDPFYFATDKFLSFKVDTEFDKIVVDITKLQNSRQYIIEAINKLNGADLHNGSNSNKLDEDGLEDFVYAMSTVSNSFIPSSISVTASVAQYTPMKQDDEASKQSSNDENSNTTENQSTKIADSKYTYNLTLKPNEGYVFVGDNNQIVNEVKFDDIEYNQVEITLGDSDKSKMYNSILYATDSKTEFSKEELNELTSKIQTYLTAKENGISQDLLKYFKNVSYQLKVPSQEINPSTKNQQLELVIQFNFAEKVNFKSFENYSPSNQNSSKNPLFSLETNKYQHNTIQTSGYKITLTDKSSKFFRAY